MKPRTWCSGVGWPAQWTWFAQREPGGLMGSGNNARDAIEDLEQTEARFKSLRAALTRARSKGDADGK